MGESTLKSEKIDLQKLTDKTWEYIKARPYFVLLFSTNVDIKNGSCNSIQLSDNL